MGRWKKLGAEAENYLAFPVLVALSRRPFSDRELCHVLQLAPDSVRRRAKQLEGLGYIVKRKVDSRWVMVVRLMAIGVPAPSGVPGVTPGVVENPVSEEVQVGKVVLEPQEAAGEAQQEVEAREGVEAPSVRSESPTDAVTRWAGHFKVPAGLEGYGALHLEAVQGCASCTSPTPLRYGSTSICAKCARVWESVGKEEEVSCVDYEAR